MKTAFLYCIARHCTNWSPFCETKEVTQTERCDHETYRRCGNKIRLQNKPQRHHMTTKNLSRMESMEVTWKYPMFRIRKNQNRRLIIHVTITKADQFTMSCMEMLQTHKRTHSKGKSLQQYHRNNFGVTTAVQYIVCCNFLK